jgi:hypothetical protein
MGNNASPQNTKGENIRASTGSIERGTKRRRNSEPPFNVARMDLRTGRLQDMPHCMPLLMKKTTTAFQQLQDMADVVQLRSCDNVLSADYHVDNRLQHSGPCQPILSY